MRKNREFLCEVCKSAWSLNMKVCIDCQHDYKVSWGNRSEVFSSYAAALSFENELQERGHRPSFNKVPKGTAKDGE